MFSAEIEKSTLKFIWNLKGRQTAKTILIKNKVGDLKLLNLKCTTSHSNQNSEELA